MLRLSTTILLAGTCLLASAGVSPETVTTCEGDHVHRLSCDTGVISVQTAIYGREDSTTCSEGKPQLQTSFTQCSLPGAVDVLKRRCDGKRVCELSVNVVATSDPCKGTYKYLQTTYTCLPAIHLVTCEHSLAHLHCDVGQVISVYGANYGRSDHTTCSYKRPPPQTQNIDCSLSTSKIAESCGGKNSCIIKASNAVFGDPCRGTYKYLELAYICEYPVAAPRGDPTASPNKRQHFVNTLERLLQCCLPLNFNCHGISLFLSWNTERSSSFCSSSGSTHNINSPSPRTGSSRTMLHLRLSTALLLVAKCLLLTSGVSAEKVITCAISQNVQRLSCDIGVISVQAALYGRKDAEICSVGRSQEQLANTECSQEGTVEILKRRCDGKKLCELNINDVRSPDPCHGIFKYLETTYTCFPAIRLVACELSVAHLYCDEGQIISVYGADYGRRDRTTCSYSRRISQIRNTSCLHPTSRVAESCNGKNSCTIQVRNSVLGDPCVGTYKYLEVSYVCEYPLVAPKHSLLE
ncbi:rhamnose-binding lectin-like [Pempheris klunzingeri]|uniref:rhamnose-binding lectin-like n=1 Tax=Pempheris klunzingeri TaxID=3127111 RepID=UPI0039805AA9